jgi:hypothetical protein
LKNSFIDYNIFNIEDCEHIATRGANQKNLFIFLSENEAEKSSLVELLSKILSAIKYDLETDALMILQTSDAPISLSKLCQNAEKSSVLVFGYEPKHLGIYANMKKYAFFELQDAHYLFCDSLSLIENQKDLKMALWEALKKRFL